jgi:hypothetical protein
LEFVELCFISKEEDLLLDGSAYLGADTVQLFVHALEGQYSRRHRRMILGLVI